MSINADDKNAIIVPLLDDGPNDVSSSRYIDNTNTTTTMATTQTSDGPLDKKNAVFLMLAYLGVSMLFSSSTLVASADLYNIKWGKRGEELLFLAPVLVQIPAPFIMILVTAFQDYLHFTSRILVCLILNSIITFILPFMILLLNNDLSFILTCICIIIVGINNSVLRVTGLAFSSMFPPVYTQALLVGQASSAVVVLILKIGLKAIWPSGETLTEEIRKKNSTTVSFVFFFASTAMTVCAAILFKLARHTAFSRFHFPSWKVRHEKLQQGKEERRIARQNAQYQAQNPLKSSPTSSSSSSSSSSPLNSPDSRSINMSTLRLAYPAATDESYHYALTLNRQYIIVTRESRPPVADVTPATTAVATISSPDSSHDRNTSLHDSSSSSDDDDANIPSHHHHHQHYHNREQPHALEISADHDEYKNVLWWNGEVVRAIVPISHLNQDIQDHISQHLSVPPTVDFYTQVIDASRNINMVDIVEHAISVLPSTSQVDKWVVYNKTKGFLFIQLVNFILYGMVYPSLSGRFLIDGIDKHWTQLIFMLQWTSFDAGIKYLPQKFFIFVFNESIAWVYVLIRIFIYPILFYFAYSGHQFNLFLVLAIHGIMAIIYAGPHITLCTCYQKYIEPSERHTAGSLIGITQAIGFLLGFVFALIVDKA